MDRSTVALAVALLAFSFPSLAEPPKAGPPGPMGVGGQRYDPTTVQSVSGEVTEVTHLEHGRGEGVHLVLSTAEGSLQVHLGPSWFLAEQPVKITKGDRVEVTGSKVVFDGRPALIAQVVKKGDRSLTLRDASGVPAWSGGPRR